jgi:hypothetical protein
MGWIRVESLRLDITRPARELTSIGCFFAFEGLEPYDGNLSRTVLRGLGGSNAPRLPGLWMFPIYWQVMLSSAVNIILSQLCCYGFF